MKHALIIGTDTVAGHAVSTLWNQTGLATGIPACETQTQESIQTALSDAQPHTVIFCGQAAESSWSEQGHQEISRQEFQAAECWAQECANAGVKFVLVSSDAVFHGPWMFHEENCNGTCESSPAQTIRNLERAILQCCPTALVVRTNVFGFSPTGNGWLENLMSKLEAESTLTAPSPNYATPIDATLFADLIQTACDRGLEGVFHVGGSERVNYVHFCHRLAQEFQLPRPRFDHARQWSITGGFAQGETSLNSGKFRRTVGQPLPLLGESLRQLRECETTVSHAIPELVKHAA